MKNARSAIFVASLLVAAAAAQGQPPPPGQQPKVQQPATQVDQPTRAQKPEAGKFTISGCIQNAPPPADAAAAPATTTGSKFELANAKVTSGGPVGTTGSAATATRYRLDGEEKTISPHLNHQVEITGTINPASAAPAAGGSAAPTLKVESVKMVAAKCSE